MLVTDKGQTVKVSLTAKNAATGSVQLSDDSKQHSRAHHGQFKTQ